jgi:hypothetical protein
MTCIILTVWFLLHRFCLPSNDLSRISDTEKGKKIHFSRDTASCHCEHNCPKKLSRDIWINLYQQIGGLLFDQLLRVLTFNNPSASCNKEVYIEKGNEGYNGFITLSATKKGNDFLIKIGISLVPKLIEMTPEEIKYYTGFPLVTIHCEGYVPKQGYYYGSSCVMNIGLSTVINPSDFKELKQIEQKIISRLPPYQ